MGPQPAYVDTILSAQNRVLITPETGGKLRKVSEERRALRDTKRAMKSNAAVATAGIITFGHQAQKLFETLTPDQQDAAYLELGEAVATRLNTNLKATTAFLSAAERLLEAWNAYRDGRRAPAAFDEPENAYLESSLTLTEMHMVLEPVKKLTGAELIQERDRLSGLVTFHDQALITPVMGGVKHRAEQLEAYAKTSSGNAKISQAKADQEQARRARERAEQNKQRQQQNAIEERRAADRLAAAAAQRAENQRINKKIEMCRAFSSDPKARKILANWGFGTEELMLSNDLWREERLVDGPGRFKVNRLVVDLVASDLEELRKRQKAQAQAAQEDIRSKLGPDEKTEHEPLPYSGPSGPQF
ncbi:hypothetical protein [Pseudooceanicola algae]|uniref:Uncharacterized protein n=1 Tax=Pseudooceanicola algae TaxID=1537215 RepID=A0A418SD84_9RHOB|nr:hypothetical protein [Pseudooceanicola algae]QPM92544.1 hypothetical protein PSAL_038080 [Pseudooceanicola algae]